jgi:hypothetical protein
MNGRTTLVFRDEEQQREFNSIVAEQGLKKGEVLQVLVENFIKDVNVQYLVGGVLKGKTGAVPPKSPSRKGAKK